MRALAAANTDPEVREYLNLFWYLKYRNCRVQGNNVLLGWYQQWSQQTPYITRSTCIALVVIYIVSFIIQADEILGNIPFFTTTHFEIYRILTSPLVGNSILNVIILLFIFPQIASRMESSNGSLNFLYLMMLITLSVNISFNIFCFLLFWMDTPHALFFNCSGFWTVCMGLITIESMYTAEVPRQLFFVCSQ